MEGIVIVGYGRMGQEVERQAAGMGVPVCAVANSRKELEQLDRNGALKKGRIAIEFTGGTAAVENLQYLLTRDCPIVCGSTPWNQDTHAKVLELRCQRQGYLMFSSNYSIGVHIFWRLVRQASRLINSFDQFDVGICEQHHNGKVDSPSGTALSTAEIVLQEVERKTQLLYGNPRNPDGSDRPIAPCELQLSSQRLGHVPGGHQMFCDSPEETIVVSHQARNRAGFARGAIFAAQFLQQRVASGNPGFWNMDDLMDYFLQP